MQQHMQADFSELTGTATRELGGMGPLTIAVCGISHHTAPIEILEQLAFTREARAVATRQLVAADAPAEWPASEAVILSTCNRVELYVATPKCAAETPGAAGFLAAYLADCHGLPLAEIAPYLYTHTDEDAVWHLFSVAAGLDSLILGEPQILGQVRGAIEEAQRNGASGPVLSTLFRRAIETGKRVHSETGISHGAASVSYAAVEVAARHFADLGACQALIVGAGKTGQLTAQCLHGRGIHSIAVANRSFEHARELAATWGGAAYTLDGLDEVLPHVDILISCTNARGYVISRDQIEAALARRPSGQPLLLLDIAVPRDIDPAAAGLPGVQAYNVEDLRRVVETNLDERRRAGEQAEAILGEQVAGFMAWLMALSVTPVITDLREHAEAIRQRELAKARGRLAGLPADYMGLMELVTQRIINQLLHEPTVRLKERAASSDGAAYAQAVRDLFDLPSTGCQE